MCGCDVNKVLIVELVVFSEDIHVGGDLRGSGSLRGQREVRWQRGFVTSVVQNRSSFNLSVQSHVDHAVLPKLDGHLRGFKQLEK